MFNHAEPEGVMATLLTKNSISSSGDCRIDTPIVAGFINEDDHVLYEYQIKISSPILMPDSAIFRHGGPRRKIYFDPPNLSVALSPAAVLSGY
jgi:hypothetical protein